MNIHSKARLTPHSRADADPSGYGQLDYFATCYTDIDPDTQLRNRYKQADGALALSVSRCS